MASDRQADFQRQPMEKVLIKNGMGRGGFGSESLGFFIADSAWRSHPKACFVHKI
jgi:hypothetical protein